MPRMGVGDAVCRKSKIATELSQFCQLLRESTEELKSSHPYLRIKIRVLFEAEGRGTASVLTFTVSSLSPLVHKIYAQTFPQFCTKLAFTSAVLLTSSSH